MELLGVDSFPGIVPFHGLGQLQLDQLASLYGDRRKVIDLQFQCGVTADKAFATQDGTGLIPFNFVFTIPTLPSVDVSSGLLCG